MSWCSKKQIVVPQSNTESKFRGLAAATAELIWLKNLLSELRIPLPQAPILWCDNLSATYLTANPIFHARTKNIELDFHFIREKVAAKDLDGRFISSIDQLVDALTKSPSTNRFQLLHDKLVVASPSFACGGIRDSISIV